LILSWLRDCEVGHTSTCNPNTDQRYKSYVDIILIDVLELRLVRARSDWKYLALSYVWGGVAILQAMIENIATLERQSSLLGLQEKIPKTIRDAMEMTKALKERYLWCNVLYIIQDDAEQKYDQIAHMDVIYRHASLTIAALSSINANSGLPGISREFTGPERCLGGTENMLLIPQPLNLDAIDPLPYERRAWTLQERIFSKRRIYFTEQNIFLSCSRGVSAENDAGRVVRFRDSWEPLNKSEAIEGLAAYVRIVNTYTRRDLSYQSDILNAFHGLGIPMENFRTRFTNGLPENPFDFSLLWAPERILHRRSGSSESEEFFPSWSWAGWIGPVTY
ncbi:HET-domain-containing protein, partial [Hyaloscypha bicolor E]